MKTLRNSLLVAGGFAILVGGLVLSGLQPQEVHSKALQDVNVVNIPLPVADVDNGLPSQMVTLAADPNYTCQGGTTAFKEVRADGSIGLQFSVPPGQMLVVTAVGVELLGKTPDSNVTTEIGRVGVSGFVTAFNSGVMTDSAGNGVDNSTISPGFVVKSGTEVCVSGRPTEVLLYGYLAPDPDA